MEVVILFQIINSITNFQRALVLESKILKTTLSSLIVVYVILGIILVTSWVLFLGLLISILFYYHLTLISAILIALGVNIFFLLISLFYYKRYTRLISVKRITRRVKFALKS